MDDETKQFLKDLQAARDNGTSQVAVLLQKLTPEEKLAFFNCYRNR